MSRDGFRESPVADQRRFLITSQCFERIKDHDMMVSFSSRLGHFADQWMQSSSRRPAGVVCPSACAFCLTAQSSPKSCCSALLLACVLCGLGVCTVVSVCRQDSRHTRVARVASPGVHVLPDRCVVPDCTSGDCEPRQARLGQARPG